jgi:hypothetical protein
MLEAQPANSTAEPPSISIVRLFIIPLAPSGRSARSLPCSLSKGAKQFKPNSL